MRKVLYTAAALLLCAAPLRAQSLATADPAPAAAATDAKAERAPALFPTTDEVRRHVADAEAKRSAEAPLGSRDWWYLVAAIAIGVIIAAVLL